MTKKDIEILDDMLTALVDLLVEKGIITQKEYDAKVRRRLDESKGLTRFEDLKD